MIFEEDNRRDTAASLSIEVCRNYVRRFIHSGRK
jgi:hypothetical protein